MATINFSIPTNLAVAGQMTVDSLNGMVKATGGLLTIGVAGADYVSQAGLVATSGALVAQMGSSVGGVTSLNGLTGALSLGGAGGNLFASISGTTLFISGSGIAQSLDLVATSGVLNGKIASTGQTLYSLLTSLSGQANINLAQTGAAAVALNLLTSGALAAQISANSAGVSTLNGLSGSLAVGGAGGNIFVTLSGTQNIFISGSGLATLTNLAATGAAAVALNLATSGALVSQISANAAGVGTLNNLSGVLTLGGAGGNIFIVTSGTQNIFVSGSGLATSLNLALTGSNLYSLLTGASGYLLSPSQSNLNGGTGTQLNTIYYDTFGANRVVGISGTPLNSNFVTIYANVTGLTTLEIPPSYRIGQVGAITGLTFFPGNHKISWNYSNSKWWLADSAGALNNFAATTSPSAVDNFSSGYDVGSHWINVSNSGIYECVASNLSSASWIQLISAGILNASGASLMARDLAISGVLATQIASSAAGVSTLNSLSGNLTLVGTGGISVNPSGNTIFIGGNGSVNSGVLSPAFTEISGSTINISIDGTKAAQNYKVLATGGSFSINFNGAYDGANGAILIDKRFTGSALVTLPTGSRIFNQGTGNSAVLSTGSGVYDIFTFVHDAVRPYWAVSTSGAFTDTTTFNGLSFSVTGSSALASVNLTGIGGAIVFVSGASNTVFISGGAGGAAAGVNSINGLNGTLALGGAGGNIFVVASGSSALFVSGSGLATSTNVALTGSNLYNLLTAASGQLLSPSQYNLNGGTGTLLNTPYYDDFNGNRIVGISGSPANSNFVTIYANVTSLSTLQIVPSYRLGQIGAITGLTLAPGNHEISWKYSNGKWWLADSAGAISNFSAITDPAVTDNLLSGYDVGSQWINTSNGNIYQNTASSTGTATWTQLASTSIVASSGQQAWTAANNNGLNLSGRLIATGGLLVALNLATSGVLAAQISGPVSSGVLSPPFTEISGSAITITIDGSKASQNYKVLATGGSFTLSFAGAYNGANGAILIDKRFTGAAFATLPTGSRIFNQGTGNVAVLSSGSGVFDIFTFVHDANRPYWAISTSGVFADVVTIPSSAQLTSTGVQLGAKIDSLSGWAASAANLQSSGSNLYGLITALSGAVSPNILTINNQTGNYILQMSDNGSYIRISGASGASPFVVQVTPNAMPNGSQIPLKQTWSGQFMISGVSGVLIDKPTSKSQVSREKGATMVLIKVSSSLWDLDGNLE